MKKLIALLMVAVLAIGCIGCAGNGGNSTGGNSTSTTSQATNTSTGTTSQAGDTSQAQNPDDPYAAGNFSYPMDKIELTINKDETDRSTIPSWVTDNHLYWEDTVAEATGVTLKMIGSASNPMEDSEAFTVMLSSLQYPDLIQCNWLTHKGGPDGAIADGVIIDLSQYTQYFPAWYQIIQDNPDTYKKWVTLDNGGLYNFPCIVLASPTGTGWSIRKDYLDQVGEQVPVTLEDWHRVLTKFKDQLGLPAPITFEWRWLFLEYAAAGLSNPFGTCYPFYVQDGKVVFGPTTENYKNFVEMLRTWASEGLLDPDILQVDKKTVESKVTSNKAGLALQQIRNTQNCMIADHSEQPSFELVGVTAPVMNAGDSIEFGHYVNAYTGGISISISTQCKNVPAACRYLDWGYTEEGHNLHEYGKEGVTYTKAADGTITLTDLIKNNPETPDAQAARYYVGYFRNHAIICDDPYAHFSDAVLDIASKFYSNQQSHAIPTLVYTDAENEAIREFTAIDATSRNAIADFVMGNRDMSEWDAFIDGIKADGIEDVVKAYQSALDRYNAR